MARERNDTELEYIQEGVIDADNNFNYEEYVNAIDTLLDRREKVIKQEYDATLASKKRMDDVLSKREEQLRREDEHNAKILTLQKLADQAGKEGRVEEQRQLQTQIKTENVKYKTESTDKWKGQRDANKELLDALKEQNETSREMMKDAFQNLNLKEFKAGLSLWKESITGGEAGGKGLVNALSSATKALANYTAQLNDNIKAIAGYKTAWDTRLNGSSSSHSSASDMVKNLVGVSPFLKQAVVMDKLNSAIDQGISYNVEQRAFLDALSDSVATTFDAFDATLKNIVRVQQQDSTAYRLGMEASLNEYLNKMFESTEYLSGVSDQVTSNLYEATSLLDAKTSIGFEYQVQKWLGSMYSVGMSNGAISNISKALGDLASGNVSSTETGAGKLLVMAASNAGLNYADMLTEGIEKSDINKLLGAMVEYLEEIANDNKVVQTQYAKIFDLSTSDIQAAKNLKGYTNRIYKDDNNYGVGDAASMLKEMGSSLNQRISLAGALENLTENFKYTLAEGIAANPALYSIFTIGNMMKDTGADINIPAIFGMGTGVNLGMTISDLLLSASLMGSVMSGLGGIVSGIGQIGRGGFNMNSFLNTSAVTIGKGFGGLQKEDTSITATSYAGNSSGDDITDSATASGDDKKQEAGEQVDEDESATMDDLVDSNQEILSLLQEIVDQNFTIKVKFEDLAYGSLNNSFPKF